MRKARTVLALLLAFAIPLRAETTTDPLWYLLSTYVLAPDTKAVQADGEGSADTKGLADLQSDLLLLSDGFESFRDEAQVKETLARLEPRMSPELRPFFKDRGSSLDAIYRTLAVTDYTWAQRFPEPPCSPIEARRKLLDSRDGLFQTAKGDASPWLVSLLGPTAEGKSAEQALDQASAKTKLAGAEYEKRRAQIRRLTLALASDKAVGSARSKLYCSRAAAYEDLAASHRHQGGDAILASRTAVRAPAEPSVFVVVWNSRRAAATLVDTKVGPVLLTDASVVQDTDHPYLFAYSEKTKPIELKASVARRDPELGLAVLTYSEDRARPALTLAETAPSRNDLVYALGHAEVSGLWTKTSGLVTKSGPESFQTDAAVSSDFSGGPALNEAGEVAGILVLRPADTEEGRWPIAIPAGVIGRWLDGSASAGPPATESVEDAGTAAVLSRTHPSALTEAGLGDWNIPNLPPPPPTPRGVCVANCGGSSTPSRSYSSYSGGSSNSGNAELGQALGKLGAVLILEGVPALFRGIGKLFKRSGKESSSSSGAARSEPVKKEPPPKADPPKPPDPVLTLAVTTESTDEAVIFTARITGNRDDLKLDGIKIDFSVNETESATAETNASGIAVLTVKNPRSIAALKSLDEESAKHPWLTNASRGTTKQGACEITLIGATIAVAAFVAVRAPVVVLTAGGLALKAPKPAVVNACRGIAGVTTAAAAAACASMLGEATSKAPPPASAPTSSSALPPQRVKPDAAVPAIKGEDLVRVKADSSQDDLKKAEQDNAAEEGSGGREELTGPADPGVEPPEDPQNPNKDKIKITFKSSHYEPHFKDGSIPKSAVEDAIRKTLEAQFEQGQPSVKGAFNGRITVGGKVFQYRGFGLPNGSVSIGTIYAP